MKVKWYKTDENGENLVFGQSYEAPNFLGPDKMNGPDAYGSALRLHLVVPGNRDERNYVPSKAAYADIVEAELVANEVGGDPIALVFDGSETVAEVVAAWNSANPSNTVYAIGDEDFVPSEGTIPLSGDGSYKLVPTDEMVSAASQYDLLEKKGVLYNTMRNKVLERAQQDFGTSDSATLTADKILWERMVANPANWVGRKTRLATSSFSSVGHSLADASEVSSYAGECLDMVDAYLSFREDEREKFDSDVAAL